MIWYHLVFVPAVIGLWLGWVYWDSRQTWKNESYRFDAAMREHDRRAAEETDAAEEWQQGLLRHERRWP